MAVINPSWYHHLYRWVSGITVVYYNNHNMFPFIAQCLIIIIVIGCLLKPGCLSGGDSLQPPEAILWISAVFFANLVKNVLRFTSCLSHTFVMRHVYVHKNINSLRRSGTCELFVCVSEREIQTRSETMQFYNHRTGLGMWCVVRHVLPTGDLFFCMMSLM